MKLSVCFLMILLVQRLASAQQNTPVQVIYFKILDSSQKITYVLPSKENETPSETLKRYKNEIRKNQQLSSLFTDEQLKSFQIKAIEELTETQRKPRLLILANRASDQSFESSNQQLRLKKFIQLFKAKNDLFVLPIAATIGLNEQEKFEFHKQLIARMNGVLAMGGPDIDPSLYNEALDGSIEVNVTRDQHEIDFLRSWIKAKKGLTLGICRGHQLIAAALGFKLQQHIENHGHQNWTSHPIHLLNTKLNRLRQLFGREEIEVNSYHHQAVVYSPNPAVEISAQTEDGTVEGLESRDGLILTTQFHPEFMNNAISNRLSQMYNSMLFKVLRYQSHPQCKNLFN